uniref:Uncharacterized protein n=1 Tax=Prevotella sp. GTC17253 TaxID=3236793 RepID=A0AB33IPU8_9BACT
MKAKAGAFVIGTLQGGMQGHVYTVSRYFFGRNRKRHKAIIEEGKLKVVQFGKCKIK